MLDRVSPDANAVRHSPRAEAQRYAALSEHERAVEREEAARQRVRSEGSPNPIDLHVGRVIRQRRRDLNLSQADLAESLGLTFQQVQKYERGANRVSASKLFAIAVALGCQPGDFFPGLDIAAVDLSDSAGARMAETATGADLQQLWPHLPAEAQKALLAVGAAVAAAVSPPPRTGGEA